MEVGQPTEPHIAILPSPGMGHIIPLFQLAKRLVTHHRLRVTFLVITTADPVPAAQNNLLRSDAVPSGLRVVDLPPVDVSELLAGVPPGLTPLCVMVEHSLRRHLRPVLLGLDGVTAVVIDLFCTQAFEICGELSIPVYSFFTGSTALLAFSLYLPTLDRETEGEFVDLPEPVQVPGCRPVRTEDLLDQVRVRKSDEYKWFFLHVSRLYKAAGIFANTWKDLEPVTLLALKENPFFLNIPTPPVHPIGPVVKEEEPYTESDKEVLTWLDKQKPDSVLFVALGSGGTLSSKQLTELAFGLELSQQCFILVARTPNDATAMGTFYSAGGIEDDPIAYLPEGFVKRTEGVGLVVKSWAPQVAVLRHASTGGFLSHCGWNSTLESVLHGVPMITWPLYAEQRMNATQLAVEAGVAAKPTVEPWREVVGREEIERVVRAVMEGEEGKVIRRRAKELRDSARVALDSGGSSCDSLARVVKAWKLN
ncbi:hypothetical protein RHGRI_016106 [Rhododendron griersonianum]|uniref:Glycosyltransferase n=1 Tax=Rhododendron griersonianum TaxID=479676 RepID=A0AAV6JSF4_9ERIC|nr:hypothetical protein RHGRI_016106 [Rhododendron griersonianum]